jgi:glycine/D-amino acid oxidase-like deaminating enzyme
MVLTADVVIIGAGIIGAACARECARAGMSVIVVDRGAPAGATSARGEGNLLISDKAPGPELDLALLAAARWPRLVEELADELGNTFPSIEYQPKGGVVVALTEAGAGPLREFAAGQAAVGVEVDHLTAAEALALEPDLNPALTAAVHYPQDAQLQPVIATEALLASARRAGATVLPHHEVVGVLRDAKSHLTGVRTASSRTASTRAAAPRTSLPRNDGGGPTPSRSAPSRSAESRGVAPDAASSRAASSPMAATRSASSHAATPRTSRSLTASVDISAGAVIVAAGPWSGGVAEMLGGDLPVHPRRGMVLVTARMRQRVFHKVYDGDYFGATQSAAADLQTSSVVESTPGGTVLIGSSRQQVGFDDRLRVEVLSQLARRALALFPFLAGTPVMRAYGGFRPYVPDHLPVIGEDHRNPGLWYATGHEGAGIGLAGVTGELLCAQLRGAEPLLDPAPFQTSRPSLATHLRSRSEGTPPQRTPPERSPSPGTPPEGTPSAETLSGGRA